MFRYYWELRTHIFPAMREGISVTIELPSVVGFVLWLANRSASDNYIEWLDKVSGWWFVVLFMLVAFHVLMRASMLRQAAIERRLVHLEDQVLTRTDALRLLSREFVVIGRTFDPPDPSTLTQAASQLGRRIRRGSMHDRLFARDAEMKTILDRAQSRDYRKRVEKQLSTGTTRYTITEDLLVARETFEELCRRTSRDPEPFKINYIQDLVGLLVEYIEKEIKRLEG